MFVKKYFNESLESFVVKLLKRIWQWFWRLLALGAGLVLLYQIWIFAHIWWWVNHNPSDSSFMEIRLEVLQNKNPDAELRHKWEPYDRISMNLKRALVSAEDSRFLEHDGFDLEGIQRAYEKNLKKGKVVAGGSTISQQLAKNLFLSGERSYLRKAEEAIITVMLEQMMTKRRILEIYMNVIEWGDGVFGAEAAARHYFKTSSARLSPEQAAKLAAMVPRPRFYDRHRYSAILARRTGIILSRMYQVEVPR